MDSANAQGRSTVPVLPLAGKIRVKDVKIQHNPLQVGVAPNNGFCAIELAGGIHINAEVVLESLAGAKPAYFGTLAIVQNVHFKHRRVFVNPPPGGPRAECVRSGYRWELDGQYPYLNHRVACAAGLNKIDLADSPNVPTETPKQPYETVEVLPVDQFRTYLIWEITDNNRPVTAANVAKRQVLARVDWHWKGVAVISGTQCKSSSFSPNGWDVQNTGADVDGVFIGKAAVAPTPPSRTGAPVFRPAATPNAWTPCP